MFVSSKDIWNTIITDPLSTMVICKLATLHIVHPLWEAAGHGKAPFTEFGKTTVFALTLIVTQVLHSYSASADQSNYSLVIILQ